MRIPPNSSNFMSEIEPEGKGRIGDPTMRWNTKWNMEQSTVPFQKFNAHNKYNALEVTYPFLEIA